MPTLVGLNPKQKCREVQQLSKILALVCFPPTKRGKYQHQMEDFKDLGTTVSKKSYHHLRLSPMRPEQPGHKPLVVNVMVVGPFEEEEAGTGIASDVVKVEGEDPATPGLLP